MSRRHTETSLQRVSHHDWTVVVYQVSRFRWNASIKQEGHLPPGWRYGDPFGAFTASRAGRKAKRHIDWSRAHDARRNAIDRALGEAE